MAKRKARKPKTEKAEKPQAPAAPAPGQIDEIINQLKTKDELLNVKKTLLRKEEWGLLTVLSLLLASIFPVYFVNILLLSFFTEIGHLWTTHLTEVERAKLIEFEKEFRVGYEKEKEGRIKEAMEIYGELIPKYRDNPRISGIASQRIDFLSKKKGK